jgi:hypothetical protein
MTASMQYPHVLEIGHDALLLADGTALVAGGDDLGTSEIYLSTKATWTSLLKIGYSHQGGATALLPNGHVLLAGGQPYLSSSVRRLEIWGKKGRTELSKF